MSDPAIELRDVSVTFRVPQRRIPTLKEWTIAHLKARIRLNELHALQGVSMAVPRGGSTGVIGANGAGKSTLLRVVAGIVQPTRGEAVTRGRIAPLIELGTGFDAELTGRENVLFNGALLGRSRAEMVRRFDEIVAFAGLEEFIDAPLRTYSTGMVARLAFSIATSVDADILLLDEILSVGDEVFRRRCRRRIEQFRRSGATIVLVSHDLPTIERFCSQALLLHEGRVVAAGPTADVVRAYHEQIRAQAPGLTRARAGGSASSAEAREASSLARREIEAHLGIGAEGWLTAPCTRAQVAVMLAHALAAEGQLSPASGALPGIPEDAEFSPHLELLTREGVLARPESEAFEPERKVSRAELAVLLVRTVHGADFVPPPASGLLSDVPVDHVAAAEIEQLYREGITMGYGDGTFRPDELVTGQQLTVFLERAFEV